jgi:AcrR family transcriptional regulator
MLLRTEPMNLRTQRKANTRTLLIEAAIDQFGKMGYDGATLPEIARAAGVTTGALYHQFDGKQALFEIAAEMLERRAQIEVEKRVSATKPSTDLLRQIVVATMEVLADPIMDQILLVDAPNVFGIDRWRAVEAKYGLGGLTALMTLLQASGEVEVKSPDVSARLLLSMMIEASRIANGAANRADAEKSSLDFVLRCVDGLVRLSHT